MPGVQDFSNSEQQKLASISGALDTVVTGIAALDQMITDFQNSPGTLSPEDQAALDAIESASNDLLAKAQSISTAPPVKA